jgi:hypothetical protein
MRQTADLTASAALTEAHEFTIRSTASELADYLLETIGPRYATVGLGLSDARQIKAWRDTGTEPREAAVRQRLTLLAQVTRAITRTYSADTAAAFLHSSNPDLDDQPPLVIIADGDPLHGQTKVVRAVRAFLEA